jgi:hypothetical protein
MGDPMPATVTLAIYRGDSRVWTDVLTVAGEPMNLTGYTATAQIRASAVASAVMAVIDVEIPNPLDGTLIRTLTPEESAKLVPPRAYWDLQLVSPAGYVRTYLAGPVKVVGDVSRP